MLRLLCSKSSNSFPAVVADIKKEIQKYLGLTLQDPIYGRVERFEILEDTNDSFSMGLVDKNGTVSSSIAMYYIGKLTDGDFVYDDTDVVDVYVNDETVEEDCEAESAYHVIIDWFYDLQKRYHFEDDEEEYTALENDFSSMDVFDALQSVLLDMGDDFPAWKLNHFKEEFMQAVDARYPAAPGLEAELEKMRSMMREICLSAVLSSLGSQVPLADISSSVQGNVWNITMDYLGESYPLKFYLKDISRAVALYYVYNSYAYHDGEGPAVVGAEYVLEDSYQEKIEAATSWYETLYQPLVDEAKSLAVEGPSCLNVDVTKSRYGGDIALEARFAVTREEFERIYTKGKSDIPRREFKWRRRKINIQKEKLDSWRPILEDIQKWLAVFDLVPTVTSMEIELFPYKKKFDEVAIRLPCEKR